MIKLGDLINELNLETVSPPRDPDIFITTAAVSDLLSNVMAACPGNCLWVTVQAHANVIGVASLLDMQAVLLAGGARPEPPVLAKAREVGVPVLLSRDSSFDLCGKLYNLGVRGRLKGE